MVARVRAMTPDGIAKSARGASRRYGTLTASRRPLPDFLVVGAKKGGTTSVANWLVHHPQVLPMFPRFQSAKSPHYFDINYWRGPDWYRSHFPSSMVREAHERRSGVRPLVGESSPYYLFHPAAPQRIHESIPDVKMIAVLREPVSRAHSNFWDRVASGSEDLATFEEAIDAEPERLRGLSDGDLADPRAYNRHHDHHTYLARGEYAGQLRRYFDVFDRDQLLILSADQLFREPGTVFSRIERFLGIEAADIELPAINVRADKPPLDPATRDRLRAHYEPHNAELRELLGEDFGW